MTETPLRTFYLTCALTFWFVSPICCSSNFIYCLKSCYFCLHDYVVSPNPVYLHEGYWLADWCFIWKIVFACKVKPCPACRVVPIRSSTSVLKRIGAAVVTTANFHSSHVAPWHKWLSAVMSARVRPPPLWIFITGLEESAEYFVGTMWSLNTELTVAWPLTSPQPTAHSPL